MKCSLTGICRCLLCTMVKIPYLVQKVSGIFYPTKYICYSGKFWFLQKRWCALVQFVVKTSPELVLNVMKCEHDIIILLFQQRLDQIPRCIFQVSIFLFLPLKHDTGCWVPTFEMYVLYHCMVRQGQATIEVGIFLFVDYSSIYIFPKFVLKKSLSQSSSLFKLHCKLSNSD